MAKHLTDKQKKRIIADYAELGTYAAVARKHRVSVDTVKRTVLRDPETAKKTKEKKEQNTADILLYMDGKKQDVSEIISLYLEELKKPEKLSKASVQSIATSLGIIIDKFTAENTRAADKDISLFETIAKAAGGEFET